MTKKSFSALLSKEIGGNLSDAEREELQQALAENKKLADVYNQMHAFLHEKNTRRNETEIDAKLNQVWQKIAHASHSRYAVEKPAAARRTVPLWARVAASVAIIIGLGVLAYNQLPQQNLYSETLAAGNENRFAVLDDGTQVWLSKHSQIEYNRNFGKKSRAVRLTGEAFFDVAHRPEVPLKVSANSVDVTVKGTAFNINAERPDVEVALLRGLVAVKDTRLDNPREILLHPNQKIVVRDGKTASADSLYVLKTIEPVNDSTLAETRWMNGALIFEKQKLGDLAKLMESRFGVTITIENADLRQQQFTGSIKSETLPQMLDALKQSLPFTYEITGKQVRIK